MGQKRPNDEELGNVPKAGRLTNNIVGISRAIAACQRCRQKKTKCDQQFPSCARCLKAGVDCVGLDPATGRQIPRSYVISLEDKITQLEKIIKDNGIDLESGTILSAPPLHSTNSISSTHSINEFNEEYTPMSDSMISPPKTDLKEKQTIKSSLEFNNSNGVSFYLGDSSGISFAKLLFTAVNFSPGSISENNSITTKVPPKRKSIISIPLPDKKIAESLIKSYFEQSNTQLPILHRENFINNHFKPIYGNLSNDIKLASNYTKMNLDNEIINNEFYKEIGKKDLTIDLVPKNLHKSIFQLFMVFSIASSINFLSSNDPEISNSYKNEAMNFVDSIYQSEDRLECLQGLLLLTLFSIMRPSTPGCWYILGTTLRLTVDLGLHTEKLNHQFTPFEKDMRRRLFWCAYSLDRQICIYLGRPFGIPEESITTKFPVDMDDCLINVDEPYDYTIQSNSLPSYKTISINFFKIRKIQSEVLQVLYFSNSQLPRQDTSLNQWKERINNQLETWFKTIPLKTSRKSNSDFNFEFFKLNYYHTKLLLFGVTPKNNKITEKTIKILFDASKGIINCYFELYKSKTINYTWAAVHNLFMAGISFFYSIYRSNSKLIELKDFEELNKLVLKVLNSLVEICDAATSCLEIFEILSMVIIKLKFEMNNVNNNNNFNGNSNGNSNRTSNGNIQDGYSNNDKNDYTSIKTEPKPNDELTTENVDEIERFFEKLNNEQEDEKKQIKQTMYDYEEYNNYPSLSTPPVLSRPNEQDFEQLRIFELMNQVSSDTIWEQFFSTNNNYDEFRSK